MIRSITPMPSWNTIRLVILAAIVGGAIAVLVKVLLTPIPSPPDQTTLLPVPEKML
jgi:hypothetical protein